MTTYKTNPNTLTFLIYGYQIGKKMPIAEECTKPNPKIKLQNLTSHKNTLTHPVCRLISITWKDQQPTFQKCCLFVSKEAKERKCLVLSSVGDVLFIAFMFQHVCAWAIFTLTHLSVYSKDALAASSVLAFSQFDLKVFSLRWIPHTGNAWEQYIRLDVTHAHAGAHKHTHARTLTNCRAVNSMAECTHFMGCGCLQISIAVRAELLVYKLTWS